MIRMGEEQNTRIAAMNEQYGPPSDVGHLIRDAATSSSTEGVAQAAASSSEGTAQAAASSMSIFDMMRDDSAAEPAQMEVDPATAPTTPKASAPRSTGSTGARVTEVSVEDDLVLEEDTNMES